MSSKILPHTSIQQHRVLGYLKKHFHGHPKQFSACLQRKKVHGSVSQRLFAKESFLFSVQPEAFLQPKVTHLATSAMLLTKVRIKIRKCVGTKISPSSGSNRLERRRKKVFLSEQAIKGEIISGVHSSSNFATSMVVNSVMMWR